MQWVTQWRDRAIIWTSLRQSFLSVCGNPASDSALRLNSSRVKTLSESGWSSRQWDDIFQLQIDLAYCQGFEWAKAFFLKIVGDRIGRMSLHLHILTASTRVRMITFICLFYIEYISLFQLEFAQTHRRIRTSLVFRRYRTFFLLCHVLDIEWLQFCGALVMCWVLLLFRWLSCLYETLRGGEFIVCLCVRDVMVLLTWFPLGTMSIYLSILLIIYQ